jgi:hypothetical protein
MAETRIVRVFVSSPSDVRPERLIAERVVKRLAREFMHHFQIDVMLWEREPLLATHHFQDLIVPPHDTDIVVTVLWSRLGVPLPLEKYRGPISQGPVTGTEWEFEDAVAGYQQHGLPELLLYRKRAKITVELGDRAKLEEQQYQTELVEEFMRRWFLGVDGKSFVAASWEFADATEFENLLDDHLRALLRKRLAKPGDIETPATITWHQGSPYRGLESFEIEHAPIFFGRMRARNDVRERLAPDQVRLRLRARHWRFRLGQVEPREGGRATGSAAARHGRAGRDLPLHSDAPWDDDEKRAERRARRAGSGSRCADCAARTCATTARIHDRQAARHFRPSPRLGHTARALGGGSRGRADPARGGAAGADR